MNTAWDQILESLNSAEDWERLTPHEWENMLKPPAIFNSIPIPELAPAPVEIVETPVIEEVAPPAIEIVAPVAPVE